MAVLADAVMALRMCVYGCFGLLCAAAVCSIMLQCVAVMAAHEGV